MKKYFLSSPKYSFFRLKNIIAFQTKRLNFEVCYSNPIYKENFANTFLSKSRTKSLELSYKFNLWIWNNRFTIH